MTTVALFVPLWLRRGALCSACLLLMALAALPPTALVVALYLALSLVAQGEGYSMACLGSACAFISARDLSFWW